MNNTKINRRQFLQHGSAFAMGASVLATGRPYGVFAAEDHTIRLALIGCGGRGTGAVRDALSVPEAGPIKLYALADLQVDKIEASYQSLQKDWFVLQSVKK